MPKDFDTWNEQKKFLESKIKMRDFQKQEIWWCFLGLNIGDEEDGKNIGFVRPVLIVRKFSNRTAWVLPMSTKIKSNSYYHVFNRDGKLTSVLISQSKLISSKRLRNFMYKMSRSEFSLVIKKLNNLLK